MLTGLLQRDLGSISIFDLNIDTQRNEILKYIGLSIETPVFYEHLSAEENLKIHLAYMGSKADIKNTLQMVGLEGVNNRSVSKFSLGMRARLAIARAIIHEPKLLILDEPVNGLDPQGIKDMRVLFKRLCDEEDKTILLSSHTLSEVEQVADFIVVLANGITKQAKMSDIKKQYIGGLEEYYFSIVGEKANDKTN